ncbi:MAG TPA: amidohydrolase family protein, partial [Thermoanaerobaculia bacterium]|nr:amidohydrolase family protein [Thermoanaerobaculia bacterium]
MKNLFAATTVLALFTLPAPAAEKPKVTVLRAARLFDGKSGGVVTNGVVVVEGDRITAAGSGIAAPPDAVVVDLGDATLLPGFIDAHVHLGGEMSENWYKDFYEESLRQPGERAHWAALYARRTLDAGFTTVRNLGDHDYVDVGLRNAIVAGIAAGPRMLIAVHSLGPAGGHGDGTPWPPEVPQKGPRQGVCNGPAECREAVRLQIKYGADVIKCMPSGGVLSLADSVDLPQMTQEEMTALVDEAHQWGRRVAAHCHGDAAARISIK